MATYIPLLGGNIYMAAAIAGADVEELIGKMHEAEFDYKQKSDRKWAMDFLGWDELYYEEAIAKISEISLTLNDDLDHKQKTIAKYGWMQSKGKEPSIYMELNQDYSHAHGMELILTQPDLYIKINSGN